jgi:hypothetical protein
MLESTSIHNNISSRLVAVRRKENIAGAVQGLLLAAFCFVAGLVFALLLEEFFYLPPLGRPLLFWAIVLTQVVAVLMCAYGWLVEPLPWRLIGAVWLSNLVWMLVVGALRLATERFADYRTARHQRSIRIVNQALGH